MPTFSQQVPLINNEGEEDDVHANRNDHDEVLWESALHIQVLAEHVSTKGSCAEADTNPLGKEPFDVHVDTMGLYVVGDQSTQLVVLGKVYDSSSTIHNVPYADDVVRMSVVKVYHGDAQFPFRR
ncbi:hypothetical protein JHK87_043147 [Glycine soja]|nr:hypothetical protein JHK87_043147 [Glycine soja]